MLSLAFFGSLGASQCTADEIEGIMAYYTENVTACLTVECYPEEEDEEEENNRRRPEDEQGFNEMPEAGNIYTTFSCYCGGGSNSGCLSDMQAQKDLCTACPAMTFEYDQEDDEDAEDRAYNPGDFDYATYCTLNGVLALEKVDNFCNVFGGGVSSACIMGTENLVFETVEVENENGEVEEQTMEEDLKDCWSSPFAASSNTELNGCGDTCSTVSAQSCGVEMLMDADNVPNGIGTYGVGCFSSMCDEDEAAAILEVVKDVYVYAQFLESIETGEDRNSKDDDPTDGLDLPSITEASWMCNGNAGEGSDKDMDTWDNIVEHFGNGDTWAVIFGMLFLFTCLCGSFYYKKSKDLLEEPLCPPWSSNEAHERLTEAGDEKNYGGANTKTVI